MNRNVLILEETLKIQRDGGYRLQERKVCLKLTDIFANSIHPGGGMRRGARAQEEDLCRNSTLLVSLESDAAVVARQFRKALKSIQGRFLSGLGWEG